MQPACSCCCARSSGTLHIWTSVDALYHYIYVVSRTMPACLLFRARPGFAPGTEICRTATAHTAADTKALCGTPFPSVGMLVSSHKQHFHNIGIVFER